MRENRDGRHLQYSPSGMATSNRLRRAGGAEGRWEERGKGGRTSVAPRKEQWPGRRQKAGFPPYTGAVPGPR